MKEFWDERYSEEKLAYGEKPNQFFKDWIDQQTTKGSILFPAEGQGRNALYAASKGWKVFAFDLSEAGAKSALLQAEKMHVHIDYQVCSALDYVLPIEQVDVLVLIYAHFPAAIRTAIHQRMWDFLRPGGRVVLEAFQPKQVGLKSGGPQEESFLYTAEKLLYDFPEMLVDQLEYAQIELSEGQYHVGKAEVVRLLAQKP